MRFVNLFSMVIVPAALAAVACASPTDSTESAQEAALSADSPITLENFTTHPAILEIKAISKDVSQQVQAEAFRPEGDGDVCKDGGYDYRSRLIDSANVTRRYEVFTDKLEPQSTLTRADYDTTGTLRYVTRRGESEQGGELTQAVFLDRSGHKIFEATHFVSQALLDAGDPDAIRAVPFTLPAPGTEIDVEALLNPATTFATRPTCNR